MLVRTPVCELLGIEQPIVLAPMVAVPQLAAAVSNAGGLGMVTLTWSSPAGVDHVSVTIPSPPALETAAANSGTATMAARTIGCSMPSNSQTGVRTVATSVSPGSSRSPAGRPEIVRYRVAFSYDSYDEGVDSGVCLFHP